MIKKNSCGSKYEYINILADDISSRSASGRGTVFTRREDIEQSKVPGVRAGTRT
jgi:hypothetical protein